MKKNILILCCVMMGVILLSPIVTSASVYVSVPASELGSLIAPNYRSAPPSDGMRGVSSYNGIENNGIRVWWAITPHGPDPSLNQGNIWYDYHYWITGDVKTTSATGNLPSDYQGYSKSISHFLLQVTTGFVNPGDIKNVSGGTLAGDSPKTYSSSNNGNSEDTLPQSVYALKFDPLSGDNTSITLSFTSNHAPVWGNIYIRDGVGGKTEPTTSAWNYGINLLNSGDFPTQENINTYGTTPWIAVPDGISVVPEPATIIVWTLLGVCWTGLAVVRRRRTIGTPRHWSAENRKAIAAIIERGRQ